MLSLFLTLLILISVGGAVSIVGAVSRVTPGQVSKSTAMTESCPFVGDAQTYVYHYAGCYRATIIKSENGVCFNSPPTHRPLVIDHADTVSQSVDSPSDDGFVFKK